MAKSYGGDFTFNAAFDVNAAKPLDTRLVVDALTDLTNSISYPYVGLLVYVKGEGKYYAYKETSSNVFEWVELASGGGSGTITSVKVGTTSYNPDSNGVVSLPAYPSVPTKVSQLTNDSGFTTNVGTVTSVKVGTTSYSPSSGVVSLPAYPTTLPASDVYSWAKASSKPSYTLDEVSDGSTRKLANYLPLSGGTITSNLTVNGSFNNNNINATDGNGMLAYKPSSWTAVSSSQWGLGATNCQGVIRTSNADLIHYKGGTNYTIYDSSHFSVDTAASANTVAKRDANGYLRCVYLNSSNSAEAISSYSGALAAFYSTDGWLRKTSVANFANALPAPTSSQKGTIKIVTQSSAPSTYANDTLYLISG